ncbi:O-methyltransferase [Antribacter gilvus]|uniref:O-methyltransferase n=1 Tax=Antribacter gilvus TaxID=2304675 RepID=UPI000F785CD5|nr:class I SAM-dependent methyltransferase [Antribacter gilvus]
MLKDTYQAMGRVSSSIVENPGKLKQAIPGVVRIGSIIAADPQQARYLGRWFSTVRRSTLDLAMPWLPFAVIDRLDGVLTDRSRVFEFGGGGSTLWLSPRVGEVVTAEHDPEWVEYLRGRTAAAQSVTLLVRSAANDYADYVGSIDEYPDDHFDAVIVDGRQRVRCFERALAKVRPGGLLILDDSQREHYREAFRLASGWPRATLRGLTPTKTMAGTTTLWTRPAA